MDNCINCNFSNIKISNQLKRKLLNNELGRRSKMNQSFFNAKCDKHLKKNKNWS